MLYIIFLSYSSSEACSGLHGDPPFTRNETIVMGSYDFLLNEGGREVSRERVGGRDDRYPH